MKVKARRFRLIVFQQTFRMWFWPSLLLLILSLGLAITQPALLDSEVWNLFYLVAGVAALIVLYSAMIRYIPYVQAHPKALRIRSPLFRLSVSYGRMNLVRTAPVKALFPPSSLSVGQKHMAEKMYGLTCVVIELKGYPLPRWLLSMLLGRFLLPETVEGLAILVEDWLAFSGELEAARSNWLSRRIVKRKRSTVRRVLDD